MNLPQGIQLRSIGSFLVGGAIRSLRGLPPRQARLAQGAEPRAIDPNGDLMTGQLYAQVFELAQPRWPVPVVFWHGGGMTGVNWETTPDGRPGWLWLFLQAGFNVIVCDAFERGRASWSPYPEIYAQEPIFRTLDEGWSLFRIGPEGGYASEPARRRAHPGTRFPVRAYDAFAQQWVARWPGHEAPTLAAYDRLLGRVGACVLVGHSQGGGFALAAARRHAQSVLATVALEPSGAPTAEVDVDVAIEVDAGLPAHLLVWGDRVLEHPQWRRYREVVDAYARRIASRGTATLTVDLAAEGVFGNSHFLMMDDNSAELALRVQQWIAALPALQAVERR
ncbi:MAG: esterase [Burkholderiales bacterium]|nr:esterase [Burkholderiales bacterium]MDE1928888.1 esterase [Burkholderiales bacterium]MDE2158661.1 esterase [Burkholderiales bacterium]MDE2503773.1 esterase [Burkholderiales bacterium]